MGRRLNENDIDHMIAKRFRNTGILAFTHAVASIVIRKVKALVRPSLWLNSSSTTNANTNQHTQEELKHYD